MDVAPLPAGLQQPGFAQGHQVLGEVGLPPTEDSFQVADTRLVLINRQQDLQAGCRSDCLEQLGDRIDCGYIHNIEYIIPLPGQQTVCNVTLWRIGCHLIKIILETA